MNRKILIGLLVGAAMLGALFSSRASSAVSADDKSDSALMMDLP